MGVRNTNKPEKRGDCKLGGGGSKYRPNGKGARRLLVGGGWGEYKCMQAWEEAGLQVKWGGGGGGGLYWDAGLLMERRGGGRQDYKCT